MAVTAAAAGKSSRVGNVEQIDVGRLAQEAVRIPCDVRGRPCATAIMLVAFFSTAAVTKAVVMPSISYPTHNQANSSDSPS